MIDTAASRPGGRTARVRAAVLDACVAEFALRGYAATSVESVAARAGVNKATVYRRWRGKDGLLADALETFASDQAHPESLPDTGDVDEGLRLWAHSVLATLTGPTSAPVMRALFGAAGDSPAVRDLRRRFWRVRSALVVPLVRRAVDRGQLPPGTDAEEVVKHVGAPLYYGFLVLDERLTPRAADLAAATATAAARAGVYTRPLGLHPHATAGGTRYIGRTHDDRGTRRTSRDDGGC